MSNSIQTQQLLHNGRNKGLTALLLATASLLAAQPAAAWPKLGGDIAKAFERAKKDVGREGTNLRKALLDRDDLPKVGGDIAKGFERAKKDIGREATNAGKSPIVRGAVQIVVTVYGGPVGAAAYSALYAYGETGDFWRAVRSGATAYVTAELNAKVNALPVKTGGQMAANAALGGLVNGAATHAAGGKFENGFRAGAASAFANSLYRNYTEQQLYSEPGGEPYCKGAEGLDCSAPVGFEENPRLLDPHRNNIGKFNPSARLGEAHGSWRMEGSSFMRCVNKIPNMNAMSYLHDIWVVETRMNDLLSMSTIPLATVFTFEAAGVGRDQVLFDQLAHAPDKDGNRRPQLSATLEKDNRGG